MSKRITIVLDSDLDEKLRINQANKITKLEKSVSFSSAINDALRKGLKLEMNELLLCIRCKEVKTSNRTMICSDCSSNVN